MDIHISNNKVIQPSVIILSFNLTYVGYYKQCCDEHWFAFHMHDDPWLFKDKFLCWWLVLWLSFTVYPYIPCIKCFINQEFLDFLLFLPPLSTVKSMNLKRQKWEWWKHVLGIWEQGVSDQTIEDFSHVVRW